MGEGRQNLSEPRPGPDSWVSRLVFPIFLALVIGSLFFLPSDWWRSLTDWDYFRTQVLPQLQETVKSLGLWGPVVFIAIQVLQVVVFIIPGEVTQLAGGFLFGTVVGSFYSLIGITLGGMVNFYLARIFGMAFVRGLFGAKEVAKFEDFLRSPRLPLVFFLLFLIPALPKDFFNFLAGLSPLHFGAFLFLSVVGRLPSLVLSSYMGEALGKGDILFFLILGGAALALFGLAWAFRKQLTVVLKHWTDPPVLPSGRPHQQGSQPSDSSPT